MYFIPCYRAALIAGIVFIAAPAALAQERPAEFQAELRPGLTFTPGISLAGEWDSNVAVTAPSDGASADRLFLFEPFGQLELLSPRTQLVAGYRGHMRRYVETEALNGYDQRGHLSFRRLATRRLTIFANNEYADVPTTDDLELNGLPFTRIGSKSNRFAGGIEARVAKYTALHVRYENTFVKFDRPETFLSDGWINSLRTDLRRRLSERLSVGAEYGVRKADVEAGLRNIWFQDFGGLVSYAFGPKTSLLFSGGYSLLNDNRSDGDRRGPYVRGEIAHRLERATIGASFEKSFVPTFGFGGSSENQELQGFIHMPLNRNRLYIQTSAAWRRSNPLLVEQEVELDTIQTNNTVGYAVARWLRLEAFHLFTRQDSRIAGGEINRQRAGVQAVVSQPMRIR